MNPKQTNKKPRRGGWGSVAEINGVKMSRLKYDRILALKARLPQLDERERLGAEDIGARLGITASSVRGWLHILGHRLHNHNGRTIWAYDKSSWDKTVLPIYLKTGSVTETAKATGYNLSTVGRWLTNNGHRKPIWEKDVGDCRNNCTH
jgi:hypothetical protein